MLTYKDDGQNIKVTRNQGTHSGTKSTQYEVIKVPKVPRCLVPWPKDTELGSKMDMFPSQGYRHKPATSTGLRLQVPGYVVR